MTETADSSHKARSLDRMALGALFAGTLLHLLLAVRFPLAPDETYYWAWSRHPAWGYFDQGPMVAWWIRATCLVLGDTVLGIRLGIVVAALGTRWFLWRIARDLFGPRVALVSLVLATITPISLVGGFVATYDPLLALFWAAGLYFGLRAIRSGSKPAWLALGLSFGLGLLSKHTMILFAPCMAIALAMHPDYRHWLRRSDPYVALLVGFALFAPNLAWQSGHDWLTMRHMVTLSSKGLDQVFVRRIGDFVGSQVGLVTPILFFGMIAALVWAWQRREPEGSGLWYLSAMSVPVLAFFTLMTAKSKVQANWAIGGWLAPPIVYAAWVEAAATVASARRRTRWLGAGVALCGFVSFMLMLPEARVVLPMRIPAGWDQSRKLYGGEELARAVSAETGRMSRTSHGSITVGATTYDTTSRLAFYLPRQPRTYCFFLGTRPNSYLLWNDEATPAPGSDALIVDDKPPGDPFVRRFGSIFERVEPVPAPVTVRRSSIYVEPIRVYYLYRCYGYRPGQASERPS